MASNLLLRGMLYRSFVFLHVVAACVWVGGILFFALVLVPALRGRRDAGVMALIHAIGTRFRVVGWASVAVLIVTGVGNVLERVPLSEVAQASFWTSSWGALLTTKLVLVTGMLVVSVLHDVAGARASTAVQCAPGSLEAARLRQLASLLGRALGVLVLGVVLVAILLVRGL